MTAYVAPVPFFVSLGGRPERIWGHLVTASYFSTLGAQPLLGRFFAPDREQAGGPDEAVVSYQFWQRHGSDASIVGKTIRVNGQVVTVIGVGRKDFLGASAGYFPASIWIPMDVGSRIAPELADHALEKPGLAMFRVTARLRRGVPLGRAEAALDAMAREIERESGDPNRNRGGRRALLVPGGMLLPIPRQDRPFFTETLMLLGALMLLIACSNVANLMLARWAARRREVAVRLSLGASRAQLVRQLLTESMLIAAGAGLVAFLMSVCLMRLASGLHLPSAIPVSFDLAPDWRVFLFALTATAAAGLAFGLIPALQSTRAGLTPALKEGGNVPLGRHRRFTLRNGLMLCQVAGSLSLLLLTAFLGLGIQTTMGIQQGFDPANLYMAGLDPVRDGYSASQADALFAKIITRVRSLPSVASAALTETVPVTMEGNTGAEFSDASAPVKIVHSARKHVVGEGYFETAGIRIIEGRAFRKQDETNGATVVIVSQELVREFWQGETVLGRRILIGNGAAGGGNGVIAGASDFRAGAPGESPREFEVVGVAADVSEDLVASRKHPAIYFPLRPADYAQPSPRGVTLMFRARPGSGAAAAVGRELASAGAALTPFDARSMAEQIARFMSPVRSAAWTWNILGVFGLILASAGLTGVTAQGVTQRSHEIGIRMALGARQSDVLRLVMKEGALLVAAGTGIGMALTWAGVRSMSAFFFSVASVKSFEPTVLAGGPMLLASLALAASYFAARRALRIDPAAALRRE